jgi:hypothetical protein
MAEQRSPFGPVPLQHLQPYYRLLRTWMASHIREAPFDGYLIVAHPQRAWYRPRLDRPPDGLYEMQITTEHVRKADVLEAIAEFCNQHGTARGVKLSHVTVRKIVTERQQAA